MARNSADHVGPWEKTPMTANAAELAVRHCQPCEGGVPILSHEAVQSLLWVVPHWRLTTDGKRLRREWRVKDFAAGLDFFKRVADIAEAEGHHPDLHLSGYRNVAIEIWTHSVSGLTENDFI